MFAAVYKILSNDLPMNLSVDKETKASVVKYKTINGLFFN